MVFRRTKFAIAESNIRSFFSKEANRKAFTLSQLLHAFEQNSVIWNLPTTWTFDKFVNSLIDKEIIRKIEVDFEGYLDDKKCFVVDHPSVFEIATALVNRSYLSHYTALFIHGLTNQVPKTIYLTFEQSKKPNRSNTLIQENIDKAFAKSQRHSAAKGSYEEYTLQIHNGMYSNRAGVSFTQNVPVTNIERTLIDIVVRPDYAGGAFSILEAYNNALNASPRISINKLMAILDNFNFIYPYHQSVGFLLERAGLESKKLEPIRQRKMDFNFYLTYDMKEVEYSDTWKLFYPKGM